jgi:folate-dependent phosphoribosylglycinamide formyltransferase PurN
MHESGQAFPVVIFTGGPAVDTQVLRFTSRLEQQSNIQLLAIISESPIRGFRGKVLDLWRRRGILAPVILIRNALVATLSAVVAPAHLLQRRHSLRQVRDRLHFVNNIHSAETLQLIKNLEPALGLVYGGPILRPELFSIPSLGTLGIHHGKVPHYRGKKTTFWAMYNGEPDVGVIIQMIGSNLDAGDIVMQANLSVGRQALPWVRRKLDEIGLDLYLSAIDAMLDGSASYSSQPVSAAPQRLYKDPTASDIVRFWGKYVVRLFRSFDRA